MAENGLQKLIKGIFSRIKDKYGYTDEQALIYLQGYQDCAEENQKSLEKRDKLLRDTAAELCEAKLFLKSAAKIVNSSLCCDDDLCSECVYSEECKYSVDYDRDFEWKYKNTEEYKKLIGGSENENH